MNPQFYVRNVRTRICLLLRRFEWNRAEFPICAQIFSDTLSLHMPEAMHIVQFFGSWPLEIQNIYTAGPME